MPLRIHLQSFWEISLEFVLDSRFRFGDRDLATKFVYRPVDEMMVLGNGKSAPSHKALISSCDCKLRTDTSRWVRGIVLRERRVIYYREGICDIQWYDRTTEMLSAHGLPASYQVRWGPAAKRDLAEALADFP